MPYFNALVKYEEGVGFTANGVAVAGGGGGGGGGISSIAEASDKVSIDLPNVNSALAAALAAKAPIASPTFTGAVSGVTKSHVGLGNVDNTADAAKPVSTAQQSALDAKAPTASPTFTGVVSGVTKSHVGLGNVDNTSDSAKPVSTAQQAALDAKAPTASPTFTGVVSGITKSHVGLGNVDNTTDAAKPVSTAQQSALNAKAPTESPTFTGTVSGITRAHVGLGNVDNTFDVNKPVSTAQQAAINLKADLISPSFTGNPTAPTQTQADNSTKLSTTAYVDAAFAAAGGGIVEAAYTTAIPLNTAGFGKRLIDTGKDHHVLTANEILTQGATVNGGTTETIYRQDTTGGRTVTPPASWINIGTGALALAPGARSQLLISVAGIDVVYAWVVLGVTDVTAPTLVSAVVENAAPSVVVLTFSENLSGTLPLAAVFTVSGSTVSSRAVGSTAAKINLTLAAPIVFGNVKTTSYTASGTNNLQDAAGNQVANYTGQAITNNVAALAPNAPTGLTAGTPTSTTLPFTWTASVVDGAHNAATDYIIEYRTPAGSGTYTVFPDGVSTTAAATITGRPASTQHGVRVKATNSGGDSAYTAEVTVTTAATGTFEDTFNRTTSTGLGTPSSGGADWVTSLGNPICNGSAATFGGSGAAATRSLSGGTGTHTITGMNWGSGNDYPGIAINRADANNFVKVEIGGTQLFVIERIAGSSSTLFYGGSYPTNTPIDLQVVRGATTVAVYVGGVLVTTQTVSVSTANTGIEIYGGYGGSSSMGNYTFAP